MHEAVWPLGSWEVFYLIIGASAAALIGLQFVVIAVGADSDTLGGTEAVHAFATPTIVHFGAVTGAILFPSHAETALFWIGAAVVLLLFIGIHNAWDAVIYIARGRKADSENAATSVRVEAPASPVAMPRKD